MVYQEVQVVLRVKTVEQVTYAEAVKKVNSLKGAVGAAGMVSQSVKIREWG